jgi:phosphoribosylamine--glycine ligase
LNKVKISWDERAAVTVVAASRGYPTGYETGYEITGLDNKYGKDTLIFQAGTKEEDGKIVTNGGRVLCVTSYGKDINDAMANSLDVLDNINFDGIYFRNDIGYEFIPKSPVS